MKIDAKGRYAEENTKLGQRSTHVEESMLCCAVLCCEHAFICYCALPAYVRLCVCMHACYHLRTSRIQPSAPVILRTTREQGRRYTQARPAVLCSLSCVSEEQQQQPPRGGGYHDLGRRLPANRARRTAPPPSTPNRQRREHRNAKAVQAVVASCGCAVQHRDCQRPSSSA